MHRPLPQAIPSSVGKPRCKMEMHGGESDVGSPWHGPAATSAPQEAFFVGRTIQMNINELFCSDGFQAHRGEVAKWMPSGTLNLRYDTYHQTSFQMTCVKHTMNAARRLIQRSGTCHRVTIDGRSCNDLGFAGQAFGHFSFFLCGELCCISPEPSWLKLAMCDVLWCTQILRKGRSKNREPESTHSRSKDIDNKPMPESAELPSLWTPSVCSCGL